MNFFDIPLTRRRFLSRASTLALAGTLPSCAVAADDGPSSFRARPPKPDKKGRKPIAAICTVYRSMSHAYHIAGRFIQGYTLQGKFHVPRHYVRTLYVDQVPPDDLSRAVAKDYDLTIARSIAEALTDEAGNLAVEGVLLIGEHGNYPLNKKGQVLYPRFEFMDQIVSVFRKTGKSVPVFNDKHLSYSWEKAKKMVDWSVELKFGLMAGSSLPVTWRRPELELPLECKVEDALLAAYGPIEIYGIHALEALQAMVERRQGGETGVKAVTCLTGDEVWKAGDRGQWSWDLLEVALGRSRTIDPGDMRKNIGRQGGSGLGAQPIAFLIEYRDGLRGTVLLLNGHIHDFCFAAKIKGEARPPSCLFYLPEPPGAKYFDCQVANIEKLFETGRSPYPVQRTLLTSGILDMAIESHQQRGARVETPDLAVRYKAPKDSGFMRGWIEAPVD